MNTDDTSTAVQSFTYNLSLIDTVDLHALQTQWILPLSIIRKLDCHYLLYWNTAFLREREMLAPNLVLGHQGKKYITVLDESEGSFATASRSALSFRHPIGTEAGYVIIKPAVPRMMC